MAISPAIDHGSSECKSQAPEMRLRDRTLKQRQIDCLVAPLCRHTGLCNFGQNYDQFSTCLGSICT